VEPGPARGTPLSGLLGALAAMPADAEPPLVEAPGHADQSHLTLLPTVEPRPPKWAKVIDHTRCIGCHACTTACKSENEVPIGVTRTYVKAVDVGYFPQARRAYQVTRCNQCADAPCVAACPTSAMFKRDDGIVDFDKSACIGCKACIAACPYDAIFINPEDHSAEKCNFCAHRIDMGLEPACVVVCPVEAILVGDMNDPTSKVAQIVNRQPVAVRRAEKETRPQLFYRGAHQATLDPLAAQRPAGSTYMWSQKPSGPHIVEAGHPGRLNNSAAAVLAYDVAHTAPWDHRVSLYTWTKGIATGAYLVPLLLVLTGLLANTNLLWSLTAPFVAGLFMVLTGAILLWDLEHPFRFYLIFTRPQWRSWLVRGAVFITAYGVVLGLHFLSALIGLEAARLWLAILGLPLAVLTAIYTAYLFAQAKARDLWQSPLLPLHIGVQAIMSGAAVTVLLAMILAPEVVAPAAALLAGSAAAHLLFVLAEATLPHVTAHAHLALNEMLRGAFRGFFWAGIGLLVLAAVTGSLGVLVDAWPLAAVAAVATLLGLLAHEHAYVQAGQSVPLA
jgi:Fe-S-cluster-containing dehydrogenase component/formate-dependent nitrite reductase membrane component NrfD